MNQLSKGTPFDKDRKIGCLLERKMSRNSNHVRETKARDMIRSMVDSFYPNGDALIREWSERDYGIDFVLELFDNGIPSGKIAFLQIKGTESPINKLKKTDEVSCGNVSASSMEYAKQKRIPFLIIYAYLHEPRCFYYTDLQSCVDSVKKKIWQRGQRRVTIRIPYDNKADNNLTGFFDLINKYYEKENS